MSMTKKIALSIASLGIAALLVEAILRLAVPAPRYHREPLEIDAELGFRGIRSHRYAWTNPEDDRNTHEIVLNPDGFRGRQLPTSTSGPTSNSQSPSVERVVFFGDSFLVGESVAEEALVTSLVEARWPAKKGAVEVYNLSTIDYGTGQELLLLDRFGEVLRPRRVVLMMYPSNDVANNAIELVGRTRVSPGDAIRPFVMQDSRGTWRRQWWMPGRARARGISRLFAWAERGLYSYAHDETTPLAPAERLRLGQAPREFLEVYRDHADPGNRWEVAWRRTEALVRRFRDRCGALNAELVVGVIPGAHQVLRTPQRIRFEIESRMSGKALSDVVDWNYPERRLERLFREERITSISLLDRFRSEARAGRRLYGRDLHFTRDGHEVAAEAIIERLEPREHEARIAQQVATDQPSNQGPASWAGPNAVNRLDLGRSAFPEHFGDGWLRWQAKDGERPGGWWLDASEALVVLQPTGDTLTARGIASGPMKLEIGLLGSPLRAFAIREQGPFEAHVRLDREIVIAPGGEAAIVIKKEGAATRLLLREIGFSESQG